MLLLHCTSIIFRSRKEKQKRGTVGCISKYMTYRVCLFMWIMFVWWWKNVCDFGSIKINNTHTHKKGRHVIKSRGAGSVIGNLLHAFAWGLIALTCYLWQKLVQIWLLFIGFSVLWFGPVYRSVFWFSCPKTSVFRFLFSLRFVDFSFLSIWFSVFVKYTSGFSVLVSNVVFIFLILYYLGSVFSLLWAEIDLD